jgi:hypothetical protein
MGVTWMEMLEKRIMYAPPDSKIIVDTEAKKVIAEQAIERLRPYDGLSVGIDDEPMFPWWLETPEDEC